MMGGAVTTTPSATMGAKDDEILNEQLTRQQAAQYLMQIEAHLVLEKQELGKVYILAGTGIIKNGGAGVAVRHCLLEIDTHAKTRVQDNDFGYQVYVMLKDCQKLLTGFELAMIEGRIRGRKVLVGGGWGQMTPVMPSRCCGGIFKPCIKYLRRCCGGGQNNKTVIQSMTNNQVMNVPIQASDDH